MKLSLKLRRIVFSLFAAALAFGLFSALTIVSGSRSGSGSLRTPAILLQVHAADTSPASQSLTLQSGEDAAERTYSVNGSDYVIYINDEEDLLSDEEEEDLLADMLPITQYVTLGAQHPVWCCCCLLHPQAHLCCVSSNRWLRC